MTTALRVLIIEDVPDEAELMVRHLSQAGLTLDWRRVDTEAEFLTELGSLPTSILADWRLPHFSGLRALQVMPERGLDIPFVIVSGSIGEETAIDAMRQGAYDYVLKDRPARLGQAVEHALGDKRLATSGGGPKQRCAKARNATGRCSMSCPSAFTGQARKARSRMPTRRWQRYSDSTPRPNLWV